MHALYWRAEENREEENINPFSRSADHADRKLEGQQVRRMMARIEINKRRYFG
jgi:hypothetical protein